MSNRPPTDDVMRQRFRALPQPLREAIVTLRRELGAVPHHVADGALDVCDRMLGKVWQQVTQENYDEQTTHPPQQPVPRHRRRRTLRELRSQRES